MAPSAEIFNDICVYVQQKQVQEALSDEFPLKSNLLLSEQSVNKICGGFPPLLMPCNPQWIPAEKMYFSATQHLGLQW